MTYRLNFVKHRRTYFLVTTLIVLLALFSLIWQRLNLGIDFVSGSRLDLVAPFKVEAGTAKKVLHQLGYREANVRVGGDRQNVIIFRTEQKLDKPGVEKISAAMGTAYHTDFKVQEQMVDPIIGRELAKNALISVLLASLGIIIYVTIRFEFRFAIAAVLTLFYDAIFTIGIFSLFRIEVDMIFIAAILTIIGYSVNDTIVIFDRIRENLKLLQPTDWDGLVKVVNDSVNQTLVRSINTVLTVVFAALALLIFGGESIRNFALALLCGVISGAYSSIFVASQFWLSWKKRSLKKAAIAE